MGRARCFRTPELTFILSYNTIFTRYTAMATTGAMEVEMTHMRYLCELRDEHGSMICKALHNH